jgi:hypothetical protein
LIGTSLAATQPFEANEPQHAVKVQSEFFQDQMRTLTEQVKSMGKSVISAAGVFIPEN